MATLVLEAPLNLANAEAATETISLRAWLREGWAVLFSHPNDFVRCELEMDRWLAVIQRAFAGRRIRPLALASRAASAVGGWIAEVSGDQRQVLLSEPPRRAGRAFDLRSAALRAQIESLGQWRFVMVVDDGLYNRRTFSYGTLADVPSPLEFLGWADAVRTREPLYGAPSDAGRATWSRQRAPRRALQR
jgi:alkyl hydroperoxide reductase subunit AhpC